MTRVLRNALALVLGLLFGGYLVVGSATAGYFATVTVASTTSPALTPVGRTTGCFLTPSMAVANLCAQAGYSQSCGIVAIAADASTFLAWFYANTPGSTFQGVVSSGVCAANPSVATLPQFGPGVFDPGLPHSDCMSG